MKKLFVAVALVMGLGTSVAFAENFHASVDSVNIVNEFKPIEVKDLPQAVLDAVAKDYAEFTIKEGKHSKKCTFYTLRFGCSFAAVNTIKPQLL